MIVIDGESLTLEQVISVARQHTRVALAASASVNIKKSRDYVEALLASGKIVYGITTGVGELTNTFIPPEDAEKLQENLIRSHAVGVGAPLPEDGVRAVILLRANALAKGYSGVREEVVTSLLALLNNDVYPYIPSKGSVGASGDLAPLSHLALVLTGEGECLVNNVRTQASRVLDAIGLQPLRLQAKEGLALINGTQIMTGLGCLLVHDANIVMKNAQIAGAMSLEALRGTAKAFDPKIHELRPYRGQRRCAANIRRLVADSPNIASHKDCKKVQDAYTLRCIPQVYGAIMDTIDYAASVLAVEVNSANDNPLVFPDADEVISGGNFHGEPLAFIMDFVGIALAEIANISERTVDRLVNPHVSGLPAFLTSHSGLHSGFMIAQYAAAALVSENKVLAHPASVDSIPTSAGQEDHVSMGATATLKARTILENVHNVLAIEILCAGQGIDFLHDKVGRGTAAAHGFLRTHVAHVDNDRILYPDIELARDLIANGELVKVVEAAIGPLD